MMQIILIESDDSLRSILKFNIMKTTGSNVIEKETASEAISLLKILPSINLVICREKIGLEETGLKLANFFEREKYSTPLLVIGENDSQYKYLVTIDSDESWENIAISVEKILGLNAVSNGGKYDNEYVPVGIEHFLNITSTGMGCDIFIRVKNGEDYQYIKRLRSSDCFTREDIEKYKAGGLRDFYISKDHFSSFVNFVTSQLTLKLEDEKLLSCDRIKLTAEAYEVTLDRIRSLGIDDLTVEIVKESVKSMQASLGENNTLASFLKSLRADQLSYGYAHSYLCSLILHKIVDSFGWQSSQIKEKLIFVSYFHDISLNKDIMGYMNEAAVANSSLSIKDKKNVLHHANQSALIVDSFPNLPPGIGTIVKEHHGSRNGIGFPQSINLSISPISMMFIVVEHFVDKFFKIKGAPTAQDFEKIFEEFRAKYNGATYQQTVVALQNMIVHKKKQAS